MVGGKGRNSRNAPQEIQDLGESFSLHSRRVEALGRASRLSAKVDTSLVQDGFDLYHHAMFVSESGDWTVVQQGMDPDARKARRYHWLSVGLQGYVEEPHSGIACDERREGVMDLTAKESESCRERSLETALSGREQLRDDVARIRLGPQRSLLDWSGQGASVTRSLPFRVNWKAMDKIYDFQPHNYEEMVLIRGVGAATTRALALVSDLIYGEAPSWQDPVKYTYCLGGKDGVPYPVDRASYDESIDILNNAIKEAKLGDRQKMGALGRLRALVPGQVQRSGRPWMS
jgi:hypothetical protein